jgi:hypothetical protein
VAAEVAVGQLLEVWLGTVPEEQEMQHQLLQAKVRAIMVAEGVAVLLALAAELVEAAFL